jgi:hypothetical protein
MTLLVLVAVALGQVATTPAAPEAPPPTAMSGGAETRELDIAERRIVVDDYHASRSLRLVSNDGGAVAIDAGVALAARRIEVTLHNVKGSVRFRANFDAVHQRLQALPDTSEGTPSNQNR